MSINFYSAAHDNHLSAVDISYQMHQWDPSSCTVQPPTPCRAEEYHRVGAWWCRGWGKLLLLTCKRGMGTSRYYPDPQRSRYKPGWMRGWSPMFHESPWRESISNWETDQHWPHSRVTLNQWSYYRMEKLKSTESLNNTSTSKQGQVVKFWTTCWVSC